MTQNMSDLLELANSAAKAAGAALAVRDATWTAVSQESDKDVKAVGDKNAEKVILDLLTEHSDIPILSEEEGWCDGEAGDLNWVVDPLDGTANYCQGIPLCCVSIALMDKWTPVLGVVFDFNRDELFAGLVGKGAWLNQQPISVSNATTPNGAILNTGFPANRNFSEQAMVAFARETARWRKVRMFGTAALSLAYVACGRSDAYEESSVMLWDAAAGCALVKAAGGAVSITGEDMDKPVDVVAANPRLMETLIEMRRGS